MDSTISVAKLLSLKSKMDSKHGCVILRKNKIVSCGTNEIGNRILGKTVPTIHAEMAALSSLKKSLPPLRKSSYRFLPRTAKKQWFKEAGYLHCPDKCKWRPKGVKALHSLSCRVEEKRDI